MFSFREREIFLHKANWKLLKDQEQENNKTHWKNKNTVENC